MLIAYRIDADRLRPVRDADPIAAETVWFDLLTPTREEETALEAHLGLGLPTKDEMQEIEQSSRLYSEDGGHFMTALIPSHTDADDAIMAPVSFILANHRLVTIRYTEPRAFAAFPQRAEKVDMGLRSGETVLLALLEAIVDRLADILERAGREIDAISRRVLGQKGGETRKGTNYKATLEEIGRKGDLTSNIRDSLATLERLVAFLGPKLTSADKENRDQLKALVADVRSLADHANFMSQKITFLLDATLGLINPAFLATAIGIGAIAIGLLEIYILMRYRKDYPTVWSTMTGALIYVALGVLLLVLPMSGALLIMQIGGALLAVFGIVLLVRAWLTSSQSLGSRPAL